MNEIYVHALRYRYYGRNKRRSRTMFPISYGPFKDEEAAWEWIRQRGMTRAVKLKTYPASENIKVLPHLLPGVKERMPDGLLRVRARQNTVS